jgi:uncharacterized protein involved in outer membrane biogenesis
MRQSFKALIRLLKLCIILSLEGLLTLSAIVSVVDLNFFKPALSQKVFAATQLHLDIDGPIKIRFQPNFSI